MTSEPLARLEAGTPVLVGDRLVRVSDDLATAFQPGDRLLALHATGDLLHVPAAEVARAERAVSEALAAFAALNRVSDEAISGFFEAFARRLEDDEAFAPVRAANEADVEAARAAGRSTTRLVLSDKMRADMIAGLRGWRDAPSGRDQLVGEVHHEGWRVELRRAPLGVVGFVFEGRPNVFADATGVLRSGNTVVFRIGSDALGTARAITAHALEPALAEAGLPSGSVVLLDSPARSAGWALFAEPRVALAVARGSGPAVTQLGAVARQAGVPVSLHGTGGAWMLAGEHAAPDWFAEAVEHSLDRKVCNTLNVCCIPASRAEELVPVFLGALERAAARRGTAAKLHVATGSERWVPGEWFERKVAIRRASGDVEELQAEVLAVEQLGREWEWEDSPEVSLVVTESVDAAIDLCNTYGPKLVASLISDDAGEQDRFWERIDTPFAGNGFTRWVDGQYALGTPELGLSNWEGGRLLARSGVLSGDSAHTIRIRAIQEHPHLRR